MYDISPGDIDAGVGTDAGPGVLDFPDNIVVSPRRKSVVLCEDSSAGNMLRALTRDELVFDFALNNVASGVNEFSGATFETRGQGALRQHAGQRDHLRHLGALE